MRERLIKLLPVEMVAFLKRKFGEKHKFCLVCNKKIYQFNRLSDDYFEELRRNNFKHNIFRFETINLFFYYCPKCGATDRERLYALFLTDYFNNKQIKILDIAPTIALSKFITSFKGIKYRTADLHRTWADDKVDITNMNIYKDESFDFIICSHVLEHIENDLLAMREIYRILSKNGGGIIMVPILLDLESDYELDKPMTDAERWQHYGQNDHVRQYSKTGFLNKLKSIGFNVAEITVKNYSAELFDKCGINETAVLYIVSKQ